MKNTRAASKKNRVSAPRKAGLELESFDLLNEIFDDAAGEAFRAALQSLEKGARNEVPRHYRKLWKVLAESLELRPGPMMGNGLADYWLEKFLDHPNVFHRKAEMAVYSQIGPALKEVYAGELERFLTWIRMDWKKIFQDPKAKTDEIVPSLSGFKPLTALPLVSPQAQARQNLKEKLFKSDGTPVQLAAEIAAYFYAQGFGAFGRYRAFRWNPRAQTLDGVEAVDAIRLENLVGYDEQRQPLLENIEAFVEGRPANNTLIYGERGTGKSSTVKALLNAYQERGLRLVEVLSAHLMDFPLILSQLRGRREKFILFVDDLSFEENETSYKGLKAVLEGTLEASPKNVMLIATSNRRHLIREFFDDRAGGLAKDGEIHGADTVEEKLSLADRFGLVVSFYAPDQETYFRMVEEWAKFEGIEMPLEELRLRAAQWARFNNGRTGRAARQFINDLKGKMK